MTIKEQFEQAQERERQRIANIKDMITPPQVHAVVAGLLPSEDIDHHASDLYIRVTPESRNIINNRFQYPHLVQTFRSQIDNCLWYDLPFCYDPTITTR